MDQQPFIAEAQGPTGLFGVFEDDGETGYLYLYEPSNRGVVRHLHLYDRSSKLVVRENDVTVVWSDDLTKVGVSIFGKLRGVMDVETGEELRVWLESPSSPGIEDSSWQSAFVRKP